MIFSLQNRVSDGWRASFAGSRSCEVNIYSVFNVQKESR